MGMGGCYGILRFLVVFINALFFIAGIIITILSTWILIDPTYPVVQDANNYFNGFIVLLIVGILLTIVGTLGCCGAFKQSQGLLIAFFCVLLIVVVAQIATIVWAYMNIDQLYDLFHINVENTVANDYGQINIRTTTFDVIQKDLQCCGAHGPKDWASSNYSSTVSQKVDLTITSERQKYLIPPSCCNVPEDDVLCVSARQADLGGDVAKVIYQNGCISKIYEYVESFAPTILGIAITAALLELLGLTLSIILCCAVRFVDRYKQ